MDRRTKRQKLQAMADQNVSPNEAETAKKLLEKLGPEPYSTRTTNFTIRIIINGVEHIFTGEGFSINMSR